MVELENLEALILSEESHMQGMALLRTLQDEIPWEELLVRVTTHGPPCEKYPAREDTEGFRDVFQLTLGRFEPVIDGAYQRSRIAERTNVVLRMLALAPDSLDVRRETGVWIDGNDGLIDGGALARAFPRLEALMLVRCQLLGWDELSRLRNLEELRLHRCRGFDAIAPYTCRRLWTDTPIEDGRAFANVSDLVSRGAMQPGALRAMQSLRSIRCSGSACSIQLLEAMSSLSQIEVIDVESTRTDRAVANLGRFAATPKLRVLKLRKTHIDPHALAPLVGHPALETIKLDSKWKRRVPKKIRHALPLE